MLGVDRLDVVTDRGYLASEQIPQCAEAGISVTLPKPQTSNNRGRGKAGGQFGKTDFPLCCQLGHVHLPDRRGAPVRLT